MQFREHTVRQRLDLQTMQQLKERVGRARPSSLDLVLKPDTTFTLRCRNCSALNLLSAQEMNRHMNESSWTGPGITLQALNRRLDR